MIKDVCIILIDASDRIRGCKATMTYVCTYCGTTMNAYAAHRAEWDGCPSCGCLNTVELKADLESKEKEDD